MNKSDLMITTLRWNNIYLKARIEGDMTGAEFALADKNCRKVFPVDYFDPETGELTFNVTNAGGGKMISNGVWYLKYRTDGEEWSSLPISMDVGYCLKDMDKVYRYAGT